MKVIPYLIVLAVIVLYSCRSKVQTPVEYDHPLHGKWQWERTEIVLRGAAPRTITPYSLGTSMMVDFINDKEVVIYHNDKVMTTCTYVLDQPSKQEQLLRVTYPDQRPEPILESGPIYLEGETLSISGGFDDTGGTQYFSSIK